MSTATNWNALPADILQRAFEMQQEGLAVCGAASSCTAWRDVARQSRVNNLYLHSATDRQEQFWPRLLTARTRIDTLKLTSQRMHDRTQQACTKHRSDKVAEATISSIPTACRVLSLSELAAYGLELYIAKFPEVEQLSIQWNRYRNQAEHSSCHSLPSFSGLHQLTQLKIHMRNDNNGDSFPSLVRSCPDTVESLILEGFGSSEEDEQPPAFAVSSLRLLEDNLPALTRLELAQSVVRVPGEDITCLSKLKTLSLRCSEIYVDGQLEVTLLTNLTYLDLTGATCYWEDAWVDVLDAFTAWPSLAVLKVYECNLFDINTAMDMSTVREVHVGHFYHFVPPLTDQASHVRVHVDSVLKYESKRAATIVDLTVYSPTDTFSDTLLGYLAAHCPLHSLTLQPGPAECKVKKPLDFPGAGFSNLGHLALTRYHPSKPSVDLQCLLGLTSLDLSTESSCLLPATSFLLPSKLEVLTYSGYALFLSGVKHNLHELLSLTQIELRMGFAHCPSVLPQRCPPQLCVPQLPLSTVHLVLAGGKDWCRPDFDWSGLRGCAIQHLTLAIDQQVLGQLKLWVDSASCLYVIDQLEFYDDVEIRPW